MRQPDSSGECPISTCPGYRRFNRMGPAALVEDDLEGAIRELKAERAGEIEVAGPDLAQSLTELGLIDEYRIYLHPSCLVTPSHISPDPGRRSAL